MKPPPTRLSSAIGHADTFDVAAVRLRSRPLADAGDIPASASASVFPIKGYGFRSHRSSAQRIKSGAIGLPTVSAGDFRAAG